MKKKHRIDTQTRRSWGVYQRDKMDPDGSFWVFGPADYETARKALLGLQAGNQSKLICYEVREMQQFTQPDAPIWGLWLADRAAAKNCRWVFGPTDMASVKREKNKLDSRNYSSTVTYEIMQYRAW